ncbi:MAG: MFS transporter [Nocardioidaceae bacterium]
MSRQVPMRYRQLFGHREFRGLFAADALSISGTYLARVAVASLVFERTGSAALTALTFAVSYLPFVFSPWLASLADLFARRSLLIGCDLARAVCIALILVPGVHLMAIWALLFAEAIWRIPWGAARLALLSDILHDDLFPAGNALVASSRQALQVGGFAIGGVAVAVIGVRVTLAVDAASYVVSAAIVAAAVGRRPAAWRSVDAGQATRPGTWQSTRQGIHTVVRSAQLRRLYLLLALGPAVLVITEGLAVPFAAELGGHVTLAGLIMAAPPLGTVVGLVLLGRLPLGRQRRVVTPLALGCGLTVALTGFAAMLPGARVLVLVLLIVAGGCVSYISAIQAEISALIPSALRGRLFGLANAVLQLAQGGAIVLGGVLAGSLQVDEAVVLLAVVGTAGIALALRSVPQPQAVVRSSA